ncbi:MAG: hypothetical protein WD602_01315, partial [Actinomycetota bacterium]
MKAAKYWKIYLNDNLALLVGAQALARRAGQLNRGEDLGSYLSGLAAEFEMDLSALKNIMNELSVAPSRVKVPAVRAGVFFGRFKLNGRILKYSDLSRVVELEALCLLTASKQRFWESVADAGLDTSPEPAPDALAGRSARQLERLSQLRREAAKQALALPGELP